MFAAIVIKIQERSPLKYTFARKLISLDPRLIATEPDRAVEIFREVLTKLVDKKWRTPEQVDDMDAIQGAGFRGETVSQGQIFSVQIWRRSIGHILL